MRLPQSRKRSILGFVPGRANFLVREVWKRANPLLNVLRCLATDRVFEEGVVICRRKTTFDSFASMSVDDDTGRSVVAELTQNVDRMEQQWEIDVIRQQRRLDDELAR